jgi:hypothetical protein
MRQWQRTTAAAGLGFDGGVVVAMGMRSYAGNRGAAISSADAATGKGKGRNKGRGKKK